MPNTNRRDWDSDGDIDHYDAEWQWAADRGITLSPEEQDSLRTANQLEEFWEDIVDSYNDLVDGIFGD